MNIDAGVSAAMQDCKGYAMDPMARKPQSRWPVVDLGRCLLRWLKLTVYPRLDIDQSHGIDPIALDASEFSTRRFTILTSADRTKGQSWRFISMSDAFDYFRACAVRALCKARSMPHGRMKHLQLVAGRIYKKEAAYSPNTQHLEDFRAAQQLERSLDSKADGGPTIQHRFDSPMPENAGQEAR